jgi:hypothetical protein
MTDKNHELLAQASQAFYEWEQGRYNGNSPMSDDDRLTWMQGYVYATTEKQFKGETK